MIGLCLKCKHYFGFQTHGECLLMHIFLDYVTVEKCKKFEEKPTHF